ncbi:MAG: MaoC family dehydratase [Mesorhizobium sp.]|uniref:Dehydratase n=1 Tax=Mesorhizobium wenxiniae TaxID=2014805 RepID=A0A271KHV7_9HYPH|nr:MULTISPECIES: MaoC family dehydratase [Mesorhizobium]RUV91561.1 MaoC family dehydratase [Mesorhizobium sp. M5C.F.Ca.IN.020.14.1.1]PAP95362.1 dehydratase [Mesorhizobium wenxiniae]RUV31451.1 MaoC family dehydratase [Mesorhizobium sp. M5C.F.Ca.IN.020.32.2.1]RUV55166.1 MaoC family dehydratase [Mesorhizobium sp. M5C.F.Ca.IN.020.29.1.1]RWC41894.1 MAG: MaoC family dehydratase [Mesorhizobium sp.]
MSLDEFFCIGVTVTLGSHTFEPEAIKAFARKYDPQIFHLDEEAAKKSVFGGLCASGWHTAATWMKLNLEAGVEAGGARWVGAGPAPEFGPSPGFKNLKWLKPVYAGETVTFTRTALAHRPIMSRPGWRLLTLRSEAFDSTGDKVIEFESAVLVKVG